MSALDWEKQNRKDKMRKSVDACEDVIGSADNVKYKLEERAFIPKNLREVRCIICKGKINRIGRQSKANRFKEKNGFFFHVRCKKALNAPLEC